MPTSWPCRTLSHGGTCCVCTSPPGGGRCKGPGTGWGGAGEEGRTAWYGWTCGWVTSGLGSLRGGRVRAAAAVGDHSREEWSLALGGRGWPLRWPHEWMDDAVASSCRCRPHLYIARELWVDL